MKYKKEIFQNANEEWQLVTKAKRDILVNNIYGVDIDAQAVEVTKLSLLLKVLEGENEETLNKQLLICHERALPDLGKNIKCGNSLIGVDFYSQSSFAGMDDEEQRRINAFDWESSFPDVFGKGGLSAEASSAKAGFDAVIGNPPWIFTKYVDWGNTTKNYIQDHYLSERNEIGKSKSRQAGKVNLFAIFILKSLNILKENGLFGMIIPNNILRTTVYDIVRKKILKLFTIRTIIDLKSGIFYKVTASTVILIIESMSPQKNHNIGIIDNELSGSVKSKIDNHLNQYECLNNTSYVIDIFSDSSTKLITNKIEQGSYSLGEIVDVLNGIATQKNMAGILDEKMNHFCPVKIRV